MSDTGSPASPTEGGAQIFLVVVDDMEFELEGLVGLCKRTPGVSRVESAATGALGLRKIGELEPDLGLVRLSLADMDGITLAGFVQESGLPTRIILIADRAEPQWFQMALAAGVPGYILRNSGAYELAVAIQHVAAGGIYYVAEMQPFLLPEGSVNTAAALPNLTAVQRQLGRHLVAGKSVKEIAALMGIRPKQAEWIRWTLGKKLGAGNSAELVAYLIRHDVLAMARDDSRPDTAPPVLPELPETPETRKGPRGTEGKKGKGRGQGG